jgi:hypothetical protein
MPLFTPTLEETLRWDEGAPYEDADRKKVGGEIELAEHLLEQTQTEKETEPLCIFKEEDSKESLKYAPASRREAGADDDVMS